MTFMLKSIYILPSNHIINNQQKLSFTITCHTILFLIFNFNHLVLLLLSHSLYTATGGVDRVLQLSSSYIQLNTSLLSVQTVHSLTHIRFFINLNKSIVSKNLETEFDLNKCVTFETKNKKNKKIIVKYWFLFYYSMLLKTIFFFFLTCNMKPICYNIQHTVVDMLHALRQLKGCYFNSFK